MKKLFVPFALVATLQTSCKQDETTEAIVPEAEASLHRSFIHDRNNVPQPEYMATYSGKEVNSYASVSEDGLTLTLSLPSQIGQDGISFRIDNSQLSPNYTGLYTFNPTQPLYMKAADFRYSFRRVDSAYTTVTALIDNDMVQVHPFNHVTISNYDAKLGVISGDYELRILDANDPTLDQSGEPNSMKCDILLRGSFKNVKLVR